MTLRNGLAIPRKKLASHCFKLDTAAALRWRRLSEDELRHGCRRFTFRTLDNLRHTPGLLSKPRIELGRTRANPACEHFVFRVDSGLFHSRALFKKYAKEGCT